MDTSIPDNDTVRGLARAASLAALMTEASRLRDLGHGVTVTYSPKVFIPLTRLCRDSCGYCTFAKTPREIPTPYLAPEEVLAIARAGRAAGCTEALFTLGDKPELRYPIARAELERLGHDSTIEYLAAMCARVLEETGLLPHANPGVMTGADIALLRRANASMGLMLESSAERLCAPGGPHHGAPDKHPALRLATIAEAGRQRVPFTTGILIGIGETRDERVESLLALRALHHEHGHIQEIIVQNFRAKPGTRMAAACEPAQAELLWTIALARITFGPLMNIQAPPNLSPDGLADILAAGIDDWGGISPVTADHVNPEAPWPAIETLRRATEAAGKDLVARLPVYPRYVRDAATWLDPAVAPHVLRASDSQGYARNETWSPGLASAPPAPRPSLRSPSAALGRIIDRAVQGNGLDESEIVALFAARGADYDAVCRAADRLRRATVGDMVSYAVNRNINYTNVCSYACRFCAFSKGKTAESLRGAPYDLDAAELTRRVREAWQRGATEVCMQGGIHPDYTGETYLAILRAAKDAAPEIHVHAFSPLEIAQGAATLGIPIADYLARLREAGLGSLPGTAAEILDDPVRLALAPDKLTTAQWLHVVATAHLLGIPTTSTIMYGHIEGPESWARHLMRLRELQAETGGITEFVPLPFVHMEAPIYLKGRARKGPTFRETILMHAVARLALHPLITNIQVSWVKLGPEGAKVALNSGANDLGGTLMNESISRAAGTEHGQEFPPQAMEALIRAIGREPRQRTTLYQPVADERRAASFRAAPLAPKIDTPFRPRRAATTA